MKLLHLGDLHLGKSLGEFDLIEDQKYILNQGMECYVEALNGTSLLKPGQKVKIPKLELKKKK